MTGPNLRPRIPHHPADAAPPWTRGLLGGPPVREWHRPLTCFAAAAAIAALLCGIGLAVDGRTLLGEPVWLKPLKFAVSFGLYTLTLAWMFGRFPRWRRTLWVLGTAIAAACTVEMAAIVTQALRGRRSHFNFATELDAMIQQFMGYGAVVLLLGTLAIGVLLVAQKRVDRPMAWAIRFGVILSVAGMAFGPMMTQPTPDQARHLDQGAEVTTMGAHSVGAPDGGAAMPVTSWNSSSGDLRVPHFAGLHAMQALPLLALGLGAAATRAPLLRRAWVRTGLVTVAAGGYAGLVGLLAWQALRGQALIRPDSLTLAAAGALALAVCVGGGAVLALAARSRAQ